jgi:hypothetical protein
MKLKLSISLDQEVITELFKIKQNVNISKYINQVLKDWIEYYYNNLKDKDLKGGIN